MPEADAPATLTELAAAIVSAYVANNSVGSGDLPGLITSVFGALAIIDQPVAEAMAEPTKKLTSAQIRKSVADDGITSFEDGRTYKTLRRHLTTHGLTPDAYRTKWGLPTDYPIVAPSYSAARSVMAKAIGLGVRGGKRAVAPAKGKVGRPKKITTE